MKHVVAALLVSLAAFVAAPEAAAWTPPDECADEDRQVPGNRSSRCRLALPVVREDVTYGVVMEYPNCVEEISFSVPGARSTENDVSIQRVTFERVVPGGGRYQSFTDISVRASPDRVHLRGYEWGLTSSITGSIFTEWVWDPMLATSFKVGISAGESYATQDVTWYYLEAVGPMPDVAGVFDLANTCLAQVRLEQAKIEAEAQAERAQVEKAAALQSKLLAAEEELVRTETLQAQVEHEETIAAVLRDIVRIRLAGQEDRARIANEYLTRLEAAQSVFALEVDEVNERIQQYIDFNAQLLASIEEYQRSIDALLAETETSIAEQRAAIVQIGQESVEPSPTPGPSSDGSASLTECESYLEVVETGRADGLTDLQIIGVLLEQGFTIEEIEALDNEC